MLGPFTCSFGDSLVYTLLKVIVQSSNREAGRTTVGSEVFAARYFVRAVSFAKCCSMTDAVTYRSPNARAGTSVVELSPILPAVSEWYNVDLDI